MRHMGDALSLSQTGEGARRAGEGNCALSPSPSPTPTVSRALGKTGASGKGGVILTPPTPRSRN